MALLAQPVFAVQDSVGLTGQGDLVNAPAALRPSVRTPAQDSLIQQLQLTHDADQLRIVRSRQRNYILFAGIFLVLAIAGLLYLRTRQNKAQALQIAIKNKEIAAQRDYAELQSLRILQINANLEQVVAARTAAVVEAKRELDIFLYESAHALRRPITRISALVELSSREQDAQQAQLLNQRLAMTIQAMDVLLHKLIMVNEGNRRTAQSLPVELGKLVAHCIILLDLPAHARIDNRVPEDAEVHSDAYFLHNILVNLLENASAFHPKTEGHQAEVRITWETTAEGHVLRIADNGLGVIPEQAEKIFDMFYRGTAHGSGQGLGLYITRKSAERIGARVDWVRTAEGGATFEVHLPRVAG